MLGGLLIGLIESFTRPGYTSNSVRDLVVFTILIVFMLILPTGLFGKREVMKV